MELRLIRLGQQRIENKIDAMSLQLKQILANTIQIKQLSHATMSQINKTQKVLLKGIYEATVSYNFP